MSSAVADVPYRGVVEDVDGDATDIRDLLGLLLDEWRSIAAITAGVSLAAAGYALTATPVFETNALVQVEQQQSALGGLEELSTILSGELPTEAELEIIRSRLVLGQAIEQLDLAVEIEPKRFPVIGAAVARRYDGDGVADPWFGLDRYAWGGERLAIDRLDVSPALEGRPLTLVAGDGGAYTLLDEDGEPILTGREGEAADGPGVSMFVTELMARPGTEFIVTRHDELATLERLRARFSVAERGRQSGILELRLQGTNPDRIAATLSAIANTYLRQNVERRSEEAAQTLEFLNEQLPELRAELDSAEHALNRFRVEKGSIDLTLETQGLLEQLTDMERQLSELELQRVERAQRFTPQHPSMMALAQQQAALERTRAELERQIRELPQAEQDALRLMRDVGVANELYTLLLNRAQELRVVRAGTIGNVRIIDNAFVPRAPVKPRKGLVVGLGLVLGGMLGVFTVFVRRMLSSGIRDPKVLERHFGMPVYAIVPRSETAFAESRKQSTTLPLISLRDPHDPAVEGLRSLRTSMSFLLQETSGSVLTIGGPAPEVGKSFVSANLGALLAQIGRRTLVVDADLRRGHLHKAFNLERAPGLVELISGEHSIDDAVKATELDNLFVLTSGRVPPNPAELLVSKRFETLLDELAARHDVVVLDAPPLLAASEAANLARLAGINLIVVRSGHQSRREIELTVDRLAQAGAPPRGFIFNDLVVGSRQYAYAGYRYYRYERRSEA